MEREVSTGFYYEDFDFDGQHYSVSGTAYAIANISEGDYNNAPEFDIGDVDRIYFDEIYNEEGEIDSIGDYDRDFYKEVKYAVNRDSSLDWA